MEHISSDWGKKEKRTKQKLKRTEESELYTELLHWQGLLLPENGKEEENAISWLYSAMNIFARPFIITQLPRHTHTITVRQ